MSRNTGLVFQLISIEHSVAHVVFYFNEPRDQKLLNRKIVITITKQVTQYIMKKHEA